MPVHATMECLAVALRRHPIAPLRRLTVEEQGGLVVLRGQLGCFYHKQLAQEALLPLLAGRRLLNRVEVVRGD